MVSVESRRPVEHQVAVAIRAKPARLCPNFAALVIPGAAIFPAEISGIEIWGGRADAAIVSFHPDYMLPL